MNKNVQHVDELKVSPKPRHVTALIAVKGETGDVSQEEQSYGHGSSNIEASLIKKVLISSISISKSKYH